MTRNELIRNVATTLQIPLLDAEDETNRALEYLELDGNKFDDDVQENVIDTIKHVTAVEADQFDGSELVY